MRTRLIVPGLAAVLALLSSGCAGFRQTDADVYQRLSGQRLEGWKSVGEASRLHWPYAWAAVAAYQDGDDDKRKPLDTSQCPEPHAFLSAQGWVLWDTLPLLRQKEGDPSAYAGERAAMRASHLRAEVWASAARQEVIVAFGGTAASSAQDWKSNLHWFLGPFGGHDQYDVVSDVFVPAFEAEYRRRSALPDGAWLKTAKVAAAGHSLGGGLAQRFAYSTWFRTSVPPAREVYAFDPSPVSGKRSTADFGSHSRAEQPYKGLTIYRIYKRGEILASVRSLFALGNPDPDSNEDGQNWVDIRYRDKWSWRVVLVPSGSVHAHGMFDLACFMREHL